MCPRSVRAGARGEPEEVHRKGQGLATCEARAGVSWRRGEAGPGRRGKSRRAERRPGSLTTAVGRAFSAGAKITLAARRRRLWRFIPTAWGAISTVWEVIPRAWGVIPRAWGAIPTAWGVIPTALGAISTFLGVISTVWGVIPRAWGVIPTARGDISTVWRAIPTA